jgi:SecD/SecF fusion protein
VYGLYLTVTLSQVQLKREYFFEGTEKMFRGNWRIILILVAVVAAGYYLFPTYQWYRLPAEEQEYARLVSLPRESLTEEQLRMVDELSDSERERYAKVYENKKKALTLGLDLQGGMHLVLEVDRTGLSSDEAEDATDRALEIIRNRIDQFGVAEPVIQRQGDTRVVVQLPGLKDETRAKNLIGRTALLEFKLLKSGELVASTLEEIDKALFKASGGKALEDTMLAEETDQEEELAQAETDTTATETDTAAQEDETDYVSELFEETDAESGAAEGEEEIFGDRPFTSLLGNLGGDIGVATPNKLRVERLLADSVIQQVTPPDAQFLWSNEAIEVGGQQYYRLYLVNKEAGLTGKYIADAKPTLGSGMDPEVANKPIVQFSTTHEGAKIFSRLTGANIKERLAIVLDNKVFSAPVIESKLSKDSIIKGDFSMEEARDMAIVLRAGALPAPIDVIEERTVGPSLGRDSVRLAKISAAIGTAIVILFMIIYYSMSGAIADLALVLNLYFILAVLAGFRATLTLPGIAGIILTVGMAVDANVLIYERIREELRTGKTIRSAIDSGYARAFRTILDANVTTIMTALVLYWKGTGPIKGFALTLIIGLLANMFTAILFTRVIFDFVTTRWDIKKLRI